MSGAVPLVDYLVLEPTPHLRALTCTDCNASYFGRRATCASCFGGSFTDADVPVTGELRTFTIVSVAAPGVPVPFVAGIVQCGAIQVRANIINVDADPERVQVGMKLRLAVIPLGTDVDGVTAIGFGFEPAGEGDV